MALKNTFSTTTNFGDPVSFTDTYQRIEQLIGGKNGLQVCVTIYRDSNCKQILLNTIHKFTPSLDASAPNFIAQAYDYLKTLPDFAGSQDC